MVGKPSFLSLKFVQKHVDLFGAAVGHVLVCPWGAMWATQIMALWEWRMKTWSKRWQTSRRSRLANCGDRRVDYHQRTDGNITNDECGNFTCRNGRLHIPRGSWMYLSTRHEVAARTSRIPVKQEVGCCTTNQSTNQSTKQLADERYLGACSGSNSWPTRSARWSWPHCFGKSQAYQRWPSNPARYGCLGISQLY